MKKFSMVMALVFAIMFSSTAFAANWEQVASVDESGMKIKYLVDKDSIQRGTNSKKFKTFNRKDGFSAVIKLDMQVKDTEPVAATNLVSFYEENGKRYFAYLDSFDTENKFEADSDKDVIIDTIEVNDGKEMWLKIWDFVQKNLK